MVINRLQFVPWRRWRHLGVAAAAVNLVRRSWRRAPWEPGSAPTASHRMSAIRELPLQRRPHIRRNRPPRGRGCDVYGRSNGDDSSAPTDSDAEATPLSSQSIFETKLLSHKNVELEVNSFFFLKWIHFFFQIYFVNWLTTFWTIDNTVMSLFG